MGDEMATPCRDQEPRQNKLQTLANLATGWGTTVNAVVIDPAVRNTLCITDCRTCNAVAISPVVHI